MVEKIGSEDRPTHVSYHKDPGEGAPETHIQGAMLEPLEVEVRLGAFSVSGGLREYTDSGASVD